MKVSDLISSFEIWTSKEEQDLLKKLKKPVPLASLNEHNQFRVQALIRKSLVTKVGMKDPLIVANDQIT